MNGGARRGRGGWLVLLSLAVLAGCEDVGLAGRNTPEEEAANRVWSYDVYDEGVTPAGTGEAMVHYPVPAAQPGGAAAEMGRHYLPGGETMHIPQHLLRPIAGMGGTQLYALVTDNPPYERLFAPAATRPSRPGAAQAYHTMMRVPEPAMRHEAAGEDPGTMDHGTGH